MATTLFNLNILAAARKRLDKRSSAGPGDDTGHVYSSGLWSEYQNRAVRDILKLLYDSVGEKDFGNIIPEYMVTSGSLSLVGGVFAKPADCWHVVDLVKSDLSVKFHKLKSSEVEDVRAGQNGVIVPTATRPVFWEEGPNIYTLGLTSATVIARYIKTHQDIVVSVAPIDAGHKYLTAANIEYVAATKTLRITDTLPAGGWVAADANRDLVFYTASQVYKGRIVSVTLDSGPDHIDIVITGDGIPATNISASNILAVVTPAISGSDDADLKLNGNFFGDLIDRMAAFALEDSKNQATT